MDAIILTIILSIVGIQNTWATETQKVVLLTSLNLWDVGPFYNKGMFRDEDVKLEKTFRDYFAHSPYEVIVRHHANQFDLWNVLQDQSVAALIWLSHTGAKNDSVTVNDSSGFNVAPIFQAAHPNLQFLGLIGCDSAKVVEKLRTKGYLNSPNLFISSEEGRVYHWQETLLKQLKESEPALSRKIVRVNEPATPFLELEVKRFIDAENKVYPSVRVELPNGKIVGVFPIGLSGQDQSIKIRLPVDFRQNLIVTAGDLLAVYQGKVSSSELVIGDFEVMSPWPGYNWSVFKNQDGEAYGVTGNVLLFKKVISTPQVELKKDFDTYWKFKPTQEVESGFYKYQFSVNAINAVKSENMDNINVTHLNRTLTVGQQNYSCAKNRFECSAELKSKTFYIYYAFKAINKDTLVYYTISSMSGIELHVYKKAN